MCIEESLTAPDARRHSQLTSLLDAHGPRLYATLLRLCLRPEAARELLQELFLRLARSTGFFQARDPAAYAFRTAINLAMEWRRSRRESLQLDETALPPTAEPTPLARLIHAEDVERLLDALGSLSDPAREAFVLRLIEGFEYHEIAIRLGKTPHQARGLCHSAVRQLRDLLSRTPTGKAKTGESHA